MRILIANLFALLSLPAAAGLKVFATVPEWAALAREIGGADVQVYAATHALQDPHRIEAKPSLIARARSADLAIATGAELEAGWLPVVLRESGNSRIQVGAPGHFEAARQVRMLEIPARVDRAEGDVHAAGNPHIQTDPRNILLVGEALAERMASLDPAGAAAYRSAWARFAADWRARIAAWEKAAAPLKGVPVVVQHKSFPYLFDWLGMKEAATLEPKPGIEASAAHLARVVAQTAAAKPRLVLRAAYDAPRASEGYGRQTGVPVVVLPFTVGGSEQAQDLAGLYDDTLAKLLQALK
ncbi:MAG: zinc ABC transporter substrate-binding protein [Sterolibacteriaceae bacterium MAG5]|nr:zinc ABC transporter substrate-binding protein [Candidatus Nitricoxidireducens bremensis]